LAVNDKGTINLGFQPTPLHLKTILPDGQSLVFMSGIVEVNLQGVSDQTNDITIENIQFVPMTVDTLAPRWIGIPKGVPVVSLADISNNQEAINARWSVFSVNGGMLNDRFQITVRVGVNDIDGFLFRISYFLTLLGTLAGGNGGNV
jgi:hypothetical protein